MTLEELERYLLQSLNMALNVDGETSYCNAFALEAKEEGFYFIPRLPAGYLIDNDLYQKIFVIANASLSIHNIPY